MCRRCVLAPPSKWLPSRGSLLRTLCVITDSEKTSGNKTSGWRFQVASSLCHIQQCRRIVSSWSSLWPSSAAAPVKVKKKKKFVNKLLLCCFPPCPCLKPNLVISPVRQMLQPNGEKKKGKKWTRVGLILYWTSHNLAMKPEKVKVDPPALQHTHREEDLTTFEWGEVDRFIFRKMLSCGWTRSIWTLSFLRFFDLGNFIALGSSNPIGVDPNRNSFWLL